MPRDGDWPAARRWRRPATVDRFAQTRELALVIQYDGLNSGALGNEAEQPRLTAARIGLNKKSGVDQRRKIEFQLSAADDLPIFIAV